MPLHQPISSATIPDGTVAFADLASGTPAGLAADAAFTGTYAQHTQVMERAGRRWCFAGDSITNGSSASNSIYAWPALAVGMLGTLAARIDYVECATASYRAYDVLQYLPTVLDTPAYADIDAVALMVGTNDATPGAEIDADLYATRIGQLHAVCKSRGKALVLGTVPPRAGAGASGSSRKAILRMNTVLRAYCTRRHVELADGYSALADPTTGDLDAAYDSGDGIHLNDLGHMKLAQVFAQAMRRATGTYTQTPIGCYSSAFSYIANPLMTSGAGSGYPTGWFEWSGSGTAPTVAKGVVDTTGVLPPLAKWLEVDLTAGADSLRYPGCGMGKTLNVTTGQILGITGIIHVEDVSGDWEAKVAAHTANVSLQVMNQASANIAVIMDYNPGQDLGTKVLSSGYRLWQLGPYLTPVKIAAGTTGISGIRVAVKVPNGSHYKVRMSQIDVIDITDLALTTHIGGDRTAGASLDGPAFSGQM